MTTQYDDDDEDDDDGGGNDRQNRRRDGRRGRRDNRGDRRNAPRDPKPAPKPNPAPAAAAAAVGAAAAAGGKDDSLLGTAADALGTFGVRRVGGVVARMVPEQVIDNLRRVPGSGALAPAASVALALGLKAVGLPASLRFLTVDAVTDFLVSIQERVSGEPVTAEGKKAAATAAESLRSKLDEARKFQVIFVQGANPPEFHHPSCIMLPHPKDRAARVFRMTVDEAVAQGLEPAPCCSALTTKAIKKIVDLEKEEENMGATKAPKQASQLLAEHPEIMQYVLDLFEERNGPAPADGQIDLETQEGVIEFLRGNLQEGEVPLLTREGMIRDEFRLALLTIRDRAEKSHPMRVMAQGREVVTEAIGLLRQLDAAHGPGKPLAEATARVGGLAASLRAKAKAARARVNNPPGNGQNNGNNGTPGANNAPGGAMVP